MPKVVNAMTIDVEDYFHVSAFENNISPSQWKDQECRIERNMDLLLNMFDEYDTKITFFVLGWVAKHYPHVVKRIVQEGHELASHGTNHRRATEQSREVFKADVGDAKKLLEDLGGVEVVGYRAPSFSFDKTNEWVYEVLAELGYGYSSSVYPVKHDLYGIPDAPRQKYLGPFNVPEIPLSTLNIMGKNIPISGGGFFRLYPYIFTRYGIQHLNKNEGMPYIFYLHPWEVDPNQPRVSGAPIKSRFRHYLNLNKVEARVERLLQDFRWTTMDQCFGISKTN